MKKNPVIEDKINIAVLKEQVKRIDDNVQLILENHLPHLHEEIDKLKIRISFYAGGIAVISWIFGKFIK